MPTSSTINQQALHKLQHVQADIRVVPDKGGLEMAKENGCSDGLLDELGDKAKEMAFGAMRGLLPVNMG
jgi:hypothetical protein